MAAAEPNQVRNRLKFVARLCDDKLAGDLAYFHCHRDYPLFNSANLETAVGEAADSWDANEDGDQSKRLRDKWKNVTMWEDEIESLAFAREETTQALNSWCKSVEELSSLALEMANSSDAAESPKLSTADGRVFRNNCRENSKVAGVTHKDQDELDGPVEGYRWRHNGKVIDDEIQPKAWKLVAFLFSKANRTARFNELGEPVYDDRNHVPTDHAVGSWRKAANRFFTKHILPYEVSIKQGTVSLIEPQPQAV